MTTANPAGRILLILFVFGLCWEISAYDEYQQPESTGDDDSEASTSFESQDEILLFFIFSFFGMAVSVFGSLFGYLSFREDRMIQEYKKQGVLVVGDVVSTEFTRGAQNSNEDALIQFDSRREYFVNVQYTVLLSATYPIRIRKQLRCLENEFWYPEHPEIYAAPSKNSQLKKLFQDPCSNCMSDMEQGAPETSPPDQAHSPRTRIEIVTSAESFIRKFQLNRRRKLQLLVVPSHPLSALPVPQIETRLSARYRLYSIMFVLASIAIAVFCYALAIQHLLAPTNASQAVEVSSLFEERSITRNGLQYILFLACALLPLPCVHCALQASIQSSLEDEYFEQGEIINGGLEEDSSLSTWNTGSFGGFKMSVGSLSTMA